MQPWISKSLWLLPFTALFGCGTENSGPKPVYPVSGQVVYAGAPAAGVQVFLMPTSAPMVPEIPCNPSAVTNQEGRFELSTYGNGDGAPEGGYQVVLHWPDEADRESDSDRLLGWYNAIHSKLTAQITPGPNQLPTIAVPKIDRPPAEVQGVPGRN